MTAREAIDVIKSECYVLNLLNFDRSTMVNTALDMAVKALSEEPFADAISRKEVIEAIEFYDKDRYIECSNDMIEYIKKMPSVTPCETVTEFADRCRECGSEEVLDKIRAEIEHHRCKTQLIDPYDLVGDCLDIIDSTRQKVSDKKMKECTNAEQR